MFLKIIFGVFFVLDSFVLMSIAGSLSKFVSLFEKDEDDEWGFDDE